MSSSSCVAATLSPSERQELALQVLTKAEPVTHLAKEHRVSRKFLYQQSNRANDALEEVFSTSNNDDDDVLFHLPITKAWLFQLILSLLLICHSSFRGVVELFRDLFDFQISVGTIHNRLEAASESAAIINQSQDLSPVEGYCGRTPKSDDSEFSLPRKLALTGFPAFLPLLLN